MQLISRYHKAIHVLFIVIDVFSKCAWVILLKDQKGEVITKAFQEIVKDSGSKPNDLLVDKGIEFCNRSVKSWLGVRL